MTKFDHFLFFVERIRECKTFKWAYLRPRFSQSSEIWRADCTWAICSSDFMRIHSIYRENVFFINLALILLTGVDDCYYFFSRMNGKISLNISLYLLCLRSVLTTMVFSQMTSIQWVRNLGFVETYDKIFSSISLQ